MDTTHTGNPATVPPRWGKTELVSPPDKQLGQSPTRPPTSFTPPKHPSSNSPLFTCAPAAEPEYCRRVRWLQTVMLSAMRWVPKSTAFPAIEVRPRAPRAVSQGSRTPPSNGGSSSSQATQITSPANATINPDVTVMRNLSAHALESRDGQGLPTSSAEEQQQGGSSPTIRAARSRRRHRCSICTQAFSRAEHLIRHERSRKFLDSPVARNVSHPYLTVALQTAKSDRFPVLTVKRRSRGKILSSGTSHASTRSSSPPPIVMPLQTHRYRLVTPKARAT
jgi:hypothetical protein